MYLIALYSSGQHYQLQVREEAAIPISPCPLNPRAGEGHWPHSKRTSFSDFVHADHRVVVSVSPHAGQVELINCGATVRVDGRSFLHPGEIWRGTEDCHVSMGDAHLQVTRISEEEHDLPLAVVGSRDGNRSETNDVASSMSQGPSPGAETLSFWFDALGQMQTVSAEQQDLPRLATQIVCARAGFDAAMMLMRRPSGWCVEASCIADPPRGITFDPRVAQHVADTGQTYYSHTANDSGIAYAAAPIVDNTGQVVGVFFAQRIASDRERRQGIRPLEARWIKLVGEFLSGRWTSVEQQAGHQSGPRNEINACSTTLVEQLRDQPGLLDAQIREISALFCDLRGFTQISERIGVQESFRLLNELMDLVTDQVVINGGIVVDYFGDGVAAMWNAPTEQRNHAELACRTALNIQHLLATLQTKWEPRIRQHLRVGIGIHSGQAHVGNAGSSRRPKYGARGQAVLTARHVEQATKKLGACLLITEATRCRLPAYVAANPVFKTQLEDSCDPVTLFDLRSLGSEDMHLQSCLKRDACDEALEGYEVGDASGAHRILAALAEKCPDLPDAEYLRRLVSRFPQEPCRNADRDLEAFTPVGHHA